VLARLDRRLRSSGGVTSFLVARKGRLVFERYYRGVQAADRLPVFSITKTVVSALVGIALDERRLRSIDQRIGDLFPEAFGPSTDARARAITLRHLLTMTGGFGPTYSGLVEDSVPALVNRPLFGVPGTNFRYDSGSSDLLSAVLTRATGLSAAEYARLHLFGPLGIRGARWRSFRDGQADGGSCLMLRPRDLLAFGQLFLDAGRWRGRQIVPRAWVRAATRTQVGVNGGLGYGYNWWTDRGPPSFFAAVGHLGQTIVVFPKVDEVVVFTSLNEQSKTALPVAKTVARATSLGER
jgi:CubicO group peptidase (beta-lactamase class C family)